MMARYEKHAQVSLEYGRLPLAIRQHCESCERLQGTHQSCSEGRFPGRLLLVRCCRRQNGVPSRVGSTTAERTLFGRWNLARSAVRRRLKCEAHLGSSVGMMVFSVHRRVLECRPAGKISHKWEHTPKILRLSPTIGHYPDIGTALVSESVSVGRTHRGHLDLVRLAKLYPDRVCSCHGSSLGDQSSLRMDGRQDHAQLFPHGSSRWQGYKGHGNTDFAQ